MIATASGNGKTTLGRQLAQQLGVEFVELDALVHGPGWVETPDRELLAQIEPVLRSDGWVIDGSYQRKLGSSVLDAAELIVWLDLPLRIWVPRLLRRSWRRWRGQEPLCNGNTETWRGLFWGRESLFGYALINHFRKRRVYPLDLDQYEIRRLRSVAAVERFRREMDVVR